MLFTNSHNGHNDNLYIAIGYLPGKNTEYAFTLNGTDNLMSEFEIKKDINGFDLIFNLNDANCLYLNFRFIFYNSPLLNFLELYCEPVSVEVAQELNCFLLRLVKGW